MRMDVRHNFGDVGKRLDALREDLRNVATVRALNKVVEGARGRMATEVSAEYRITKREANENLRTEKASAKAGKFFMSARLFAPSRKKGRGFNMIRFVVGAKIKGGWGKRQLKIQVKRSGFKAQYTGAFIGNGGRTVFARIDGAAKVKAESGAHVGKWRQPIKSVTTVDVPQMFNTKRVNKRVRDYIAQRAPIVLQQEINFVTRKRK